MKYRLFLLLTLAATMCGCITEYDPPYDLDDMAGLLVVEGVITNGQTVITLSRSVGVNAKQATASQPVYGAQVWIESEDGERYEATNGIIVGPNYPDYPSIVDPGGYYEPGKYTAEIPRLNPERRYRLRISLDGEEYESRYRAPQRAAEITEIDFHLKGEGGPVQVRLDVRGENDQTGYYLWSYEETWEVTAYQQATHYLGSERDIYNYYSMGEARVFGYRAQEYPNFLSPYYYGWKRGNSRSILLGNSNRMSENRLMDHVLYEIETDNDRLSILYHTKVRQYSLGEEAYTYLYNLKRNAEETGNIFAPMPSEMRGNIVCTTNPERPVIGYVEVAECTEKEGWLERGGGHYDRPSHLCDQIYSEDIQKTLVDDPFNAYLLYSYVDGTMWTYKNCIDCRELGATKNRPYFWPNEHY